MKISEIVVENYKIFKGKHTVTIKNNLVFLVGENNTGKSTLFETVDFVKLGLPKDKKIANIKNKAAGAGEHVRCTIKFVGSIKEVIKDFSEAKYEPYVFVEDGVETLLVQRSSEERTITQATKQKELSIKTITLWNEKTSQFENPSGIDSVLGTLFEAQFVWADTDPADVSDFGSTKICGRLLSAAVGDFFESEQWEEFEKIHEKTFHGEDDSISKRAVSIEEKVTEILKEQYGKGDIKFNFSLPETSAFLKAGNITVDDGVVTRLEEKGTGMQRAVALAMIQVYAQKLIVHPEDPNKTKPLFFFIDEPENCLHPKAQQQLMAALVAISKVRQIFISTHSPYILKNFNSSDHDLYIFEKNDNSVSATTSAKLNLFPWSPSWGEINYRAYQLSTTEFHNELYGFLQEKEQKASEPDIEAYFVTKSLSKSKQWVRVRNGVAATGHAVTLMTFIRNTIHHPENRNNADFSEVELKASIDEMIKLL